MSHALATECQAQLGSSQAFEKIASLIQELLGVSLFVLISDANRVVPVFPSNWDAILPDFCSLLQRSRRGRQECAACRCTLALRVTEQVPSEYTCYGGIRSLVFALGIPQYRGRILVKTSGFLREVPRTTWKSVRRSLVPMDIELAEAAKAYKNLPLLTSEQVGLGQRLVEVAARFVMELLDPVADTRPDSDVAEVIHARTRGPEFMQFEQLTKDFTCRLPGESKASALVNILTACIRDDPGKIYDLGILAKELHMTANHLSVLFHQQNGIRFSDFLMRERLALAQRYLRDPRLRISEIAVASGFADVSYFSRTFKQKTGLTPTAWRTRHVFETGPATTSQ